MSFTPTPINPVTDTVKPSPFIAFTQRVIPATFDQSLSYQEALYALLKYLKEVSEAVNANAEITDQQTKVIEELTSYVNNYFDNLDVQEEINNKLDEMAESGELAQIISAYLNTGSILAFDTPAEMSTVQTLHNGSFARTYGKDTYNDGKGAFYKVRNILSTDVIDGDNIVQLYDPSIIAEKMPDFNINKLNSDLAELALTVANNKEELEEKINEKTEGFKLNLMRDCIYDLASSEYTQGSAVVGNKLYIAQPTTSNQGNLVVLNLSTKQYDTTISNLTMYHGGDLCAVGTKIYMSPWDATAGKILNIYDTSSGLSSQIAPFEEITTTKTTIGGIATFDDTKILCILTTTNLPNDDLSQNEYYIYDTVSGEVTELEWDNTANIHATGSVYALQGTACVGNHYYMNTSLDNNLLDFIIDEENNKLILNSIINMPYIDNSGLLIGEYEGLSNAETVFGKGALCITSHIMDNGTAKRTVKTYIINPLHNTPNFELKSTTDLSSVGDSLFVYCDPAATSLYEDGTATYPYHTLARACEATTSKNIRAEHIEVLLKSDTQQHYYIDTIKGFKNLYISAGDNNGHHIHITRIVNANVHIGQSPDYSNRLNVHFNSYSGAITYGTIVASEVFIHYANLLVDGDRIVVQQASRIQFSMIGSVTCAGNLFMFLRGGSILYDATPAITFNGGSANPCAYYMEQSAVLYVRGGTYSSSDVGDQNSNKKIRASLTSCMIFFPWTHS